MARTRNMVSIDPDTDPETIRRIQRMLLTRPKPPADDTQEARKARAEEAERKARDKK